MDEEGGGLMEWIRTEERLPRLRNGAPVEVIAAIAGAKKATTLWFNGEAFEDDYGDTCCVTHWMPLPELPECGWKKSECCRCFCAVDGTQKGAMCNMMKRVSLTPKALALQCWVAPALELLIALQLIDDELFAYEKKADEYDGEWIRAASAETQERRREINLRLVHYRLTIADMIKAMDLSDHSPKMQAAIRRYAYLRYYRGLPVTRKGSMATIENKMGLSRSMLALINRVALNRLALVWDENEPPV